MSKNIFNNLNFSLENEVVEEIFKNDKFRIERILSCGQTSEWMEQNEDEWVCVINGIEIIEYESGEKIELSRGDTLFIPAKTKHKVSYTSKECIWLCIFA